VSPLKTIIDRNNPTHDPEVTKTIVRSAVVLVIAFLGAIVFLVNAGHSQELQRIGILFAQGVGFLLNFYILHKVNRSAGGRAAQAVMQSESNSEKIDEIRQEQRDVKVKLDNGFNKIEHVAEVITANTPPPGSIPRVKGPQE
jgi:hypothetical protein